MHKVNKKNFLAFLAFHAGVLAAVVFYFTWHRLLLAAIVLTVSLCPGIGACWHRLLTHRGYKTPKGVEYTLTICGYLALQGGAIWWVTWHRIHHRFTEQPGEDPHTPRDGKWWSHMDWMIHMDPKLKDKALLERHAPDLCRDKLHVFLNNFQWLPITVLGLGVLFTLGFPAMCWAVFVPVVIGWHSTWLVNSATHLWGSRAFNTKDDSRNNWWVAFLTFGEGWHNNHHARPVSARHGIRWYQYDPNWYFIAGLRLLGLARDVKVN